MVGEPLDQGAAVEEFRRQNGRDNGVPCVLGEVEILQRMRAAGLRWMGQAGQMKGYLTREMLQTERRCDTCDPSEWCAILCKECGGRIPSLDPQARALLAEGPCGEYKKGGEARAVCDGYKQVRHVGHRSGPTHQRKPGGKCGLHQRHFQYMRGKVWLCPECFQDYAEVVYELAHMVETEPGALGQGEGMVGHLGEMDEAHRVEEQGPSGAAAPGPARGGRMEEPPMGWEGEEYGTADWEQRERDRKGKGADRGQDQ
jgi:hypothetical protein